MYLYVFITMCTDSSIFHKQVYDKTRGSAGGLKMVLLEKKQQVKS